MNKKILIIDDNPEFCELLSSLLSRRGHAVTHVESGPQALNVLGLGLSPDLIFLDFQMDDMRGDEFYKEFKHTYPKSTTPVIMLTAMEAGYLPPCDVNEVVSKMMDYKSIVSVMDGYLEKYN